MSKLLRIIQDKKSSELRKCLVILNFSMLLLLIPDGMLFLIAIFLGKLLWTGAYTAITKPGLLKEA